MIYVSTVKGQNELQLFLNKQNVRDNIVIITQSGKEYTVIYKL